MANDKTQMVHPRLTAIVLMAVILALNVGLLLWTKNLPQSNPEELFLSRTSNQLLDHYYQASGAGRPMLFSFDKKATQGLFDAQPLQAYLDSWASERAIPFLKTPLSAPVSSDAKKELMPLEGDDFWAGIMEFPRQLKGIELAQELDHFLQGIPAALPKPALAGLPALNVALNQASQQIGQTLFPLLFAASLFLCLIILRHLPSALLLFMASLSGPAIGLGLIKLLYGPMDMITAIIPVLLFILNLSMGFHLYYSLLATNDAKLALMEKIKPIILQVGTTAIGLLSLYSSQIESIRRFGLVSAIGLCLSTVVHLLFFYAAHQLWRPSPQRRRPWVLKANSIWTKNLKMAYIIPISIIVLSASAFTWRLLRVESEALFYFPEHHWVRQGQDLIQQQLMGNPNFEVFIYDDSFKQQSAWENPALLKKLWQLEKVILSKPAFAQHQILSPGHLVAGANAIYSGSEDIPAIGLALAPLTSAIAQRLSSEVQESLANRQIYRMVIMGPHADDQTYLTMEQELQTLLQGERYEITGPYYAMRTGQHSLFATLFWSFAGSLVVILLVSMLYYRHWRTLFSFTLVNVLPIAATIVVMPALGLSINVATVMTFSIALGMVVDGTYHLCHDYGRQTSKETMVVQTISPMVFSTLLLVICFGCFAINDFLPIRHFGPTLAISLLLGLLADVFLLERLLGKTQRKEFTPS